MDRREFLRGIAANGVGLAGLGASVHGAQLNVESAQRALAERRIAKIEAKCSNDRYCAHLAAGLGNFDIVEGIPGQATGMDYSAFRFDNGNLVIPDLAGFGLGLSL